MPPPTLDIQIQSTTTIFPSTPLNHPTTTALSILDNTSANFARCAAIWYFPLPSSTSPLTPNDLATSLSHTINSYRPWCGRLSYTTSPFTTHGPQSTRYQRISTTYNTPNDIGMPLTIAASPHPLSLFLPSVRTRKTSLKAWNASDNIPSSTLLPATKLSLSSASATADSPNVVIQLTSFACGSLAFGIAITHCLTDALSLSRFANDWALTSRSLTSSKSLSSPSLSLNLPELSPIFDPRRLDACAAGDINGPPNEEIQRKARELPQHRYDWYTPVPGQPWPNPKPEDFDDAVAGTAMEDEVGLSSSIPIPWEQWDTTLPVSHRLLHFSKEEILVIYKQANSNSSSDPEIKEKGDGDGEGDGKRISKHDALLAHLWSLIIMSHNLPQGTTCYLDLTFGVRGRVEPPLPDGFLGSPIMHVAIPSTSTSTSNSTSASSKAGGVDVSVGDLARKIRSHLGKFGPEEISYILHDRAFEIAPQRLWGACLGREHVLLTTWVHSGVYDVVFAEGCRAVWVEAVMPPLDGLVEIMEAPGEGKMGEGGSWIDDGVDVSIFLEAAVMERLLGNHGLWGEL